MPPSPRRLRLASLLRAVVSLPVLVALLVGPPLLLVSIGQLPEGLPDSRDLWETGLEEALPSLVTVTCWSLWGYFVWCVAAEAATLVRRVPARVRASRRPGPRGLAATLLGGILLLPAAQAGATPAAAAVPISDTFVPEEGGQPEQVSRAAHGYPSHTVMGGGETVWDISLRYFGTGERFAEIRDLNERLGNQLPKTVALRPGTVVFLPHDAAQPRQAVSASDAIGAEPEFTVPRAGLTIEDIARQQMGDPERAADIVALNPGIEADQGADGTLRPGTVLAMPSDYTPPAQSPVEEEEQDEQSVGADDVAGGGQARGTVEHIVRPGETLWGIAGDHRGDATEWREVYADNRDVIGGDPDLIHPGQELIIHESGLAEAERHDQEPTPPAVEDPPQDGSVEAEEPETGDRTDAGQEGSVEERQEQEAAPTGPPTQGDTAAPDRETSTDATQTGQPDTETAAGVPASVIALGAAGALAAGVLALVARNRKLQQRRRRPGRRIPKPTGSAATVEQALRYVEISDQLAHLRRALQTAAANLAAADGELPELAAVALTPRGATLHLAEPAASVAPFTPADDTENGVAARRWHVAAGSRLVSSAEELRDAEMPYPALVSIGRTGEGALVLVDLEHVGALHLVGERRRQMLRTLAAELSCSELADDLELALVGRGLAPNLDQLGSPERITRYDSVAEAVPVLAAQYREQQDALTALDVEHLRQARLSDGLDGAWAPLIILADSAFTTDASGDEAALNQLMEMVSTGPRAAAAVVASGTPIDADDAVAHPEGVWVLTTDPGASVVVPGTDLAVTVEPLSDEDYADLVNITTTALSGHDVPASPPSAAPSLAKPGVPDRAAVDNAEEDEDGRDGEAGRPESATSVVLAPAGENPGGVGGLDLFEGLATYGSESTEEAADGDEAAYDAVTAEAPSSPELAGSRAEGIERGRPGLVPPAPRAPSPAEDSAEKADGPMIRVLGPVDIIGARGTISSARRRGALEAAAWLVLNPDADRHALDEALWPGLPRVDKSTRNPRISQVRSWLGRDEDGEPYLPRATYRFSNAVRCDWVVFQQLVAAADQTEGDAAEDLLHQALGLVRGRPFAGTDPRRYVWAEHLIQDMVSAIVDAAAELAELYLTRSAARDALWAATKGLEAAPEAEQLHRVVFRAHHAMGDADGLERAARRLDVLLAEWQVDMEGDTAILLRELLEGPRAARR